MFSVTTPATSYALLTAAELRTAAGVTGTSYDADLETIGLGVAADIANACDVTDDGVNPPTLRRESVTQTFRHGCDFRTYKALILARRFVSSVVVVENDITLVLTTDYLVEAAAGLLTRVTQDAIDVWPAGTIVVTYDAGFATVSADLRGAAMELVRLRWSQRPGARDPSIRQEVVEGVGSTTYWINPVSDPLFPQSVRDRLIRYRTYNV